MTDREEILKRIKKSVSETAPGATTILYGSYARGDYRADSDIDLMILVDKEKLSYEEEKSIKYPLYDIEFDLGIVISPRVMPRHLWQSRQGKTPYYENVAREGIVL